jgi:hypothetical protein
MSARLLLFLVALIAAAAGSARADVPEAQPVAPSVPEGTWIECPRCRPEHWTSDPARFFVALRADLGYLYVKPRLSLGFGKPFSVWTGIEAVPYATPDSTGGYSGLRLQIDWFEVRAGARYVHAFWRQFLTPQPSYNLVDLAEITGHNANYADLEAEAHAAIPAGPGSILVLGTAELIRLVPSGYFVYDETLRVVVSPPPVFRWRLGYSIPFMAERNARLGLIGEVLAIPDRKAQVYRAGILATFDVDDHLQAIATILAPVRTVDSLGLLGADYTELGIRYRWATGHTHTPQERIPPRDVAEARDGFSY